MEGESTFEIISISTIPFNPIKPIYFMRTPDVTHEEKELALETLEEILDIAEVRGQISIIDFDVWRQANYKNSDGQLIPHMSVDWYVNKWLNQQRNQVNVDKGITQLFLDPWNKKQPHYDVILTAYDLYLPNTNFVIGVADGRRGTIISVKRFRGMKNKRMERETKKQALFHEVGHMLDLPNEKRGFDLEYSLGIHCTNKCAMRQGLCVPYDWINFVNDRQRTGQVYCDQCTQDLKAYFRK